MPFENLRVRRLLVSGAYSLDVTFNTDRRYFVLQGENSSGKTTFVKLILFGLGADISNFIPELRKSNHVLLEATLAGELYTFKRYINSTPHLIYASVGSVSEFQEESARVFSVLEGLAPESFQDFVMGRLGMKDRQVIVRSTGDITRLSWTQILALTYVDQYTEAALIYWSTGTRSEPVEIKRKRMETVFNLNFDQIDDLESKRSALNRTHSQHERELNGALRFVQDFGLQDRAGLLELTGSLNEATQEISLTKDRIVSAKQHMRTGSSHLDSVRVEITALGADLQSLERDILVTLNRINDYQRLLNEIDREHSRVDVAQNVQVHLSGIAVSTCPNCLQPIAPVPVEADTCYVCHQALSSDSTPPRSDMVLELDDKSRDVQAALAYQEESLHRLTRMREEVSKAKAERESTLNRLTAEMIAPFLTDLEQSHLRLSDLERERDELSAKLKAFEQTERYRHELAKLSHDLNRINATLRQLRAQNQKQLPRYIGILLDSMLMFLSDIMPDLVSVSLEPTSYLPIVNERDVIHLDSASDRVIVRLAFMFSVLALALHTDVKHPRLLLLDSPRDKDLDKHRFGAIMDKFRSLVEKSPVDCQVIITTSEVPENLEDCVFLRTTPTAEGYLLQRKPPN